MNQRVTGLVIAGLGIALTLVGVVGMLTSNATPEDDAASSDPVVPTSQTASSPDSETTVTTEPLTEAATSVTDSSSVSTTSAGVTTTSSATTTTLPGSTLVVDFVQQFAAALEAGDRDFVRSRLHPIVVEAFGEDLCEQWIDAEIMTLSDYGLTSEPRGPTDETVATPNGNRVIPDAYRASTRFRFQGSTFESEAGFALIEGVVHWLGQCR